MDTLLGLLAVAALVAMNGFFVAAEFSLVGARRTRVAQLAAEGNKGAQAAERAFRQLDSYIAATQLGITLASLGLGWIGEETVTHLIEPLFALFLPEEALHTVGRSVAVALSFALVTMLHIVLGELAPKTIALQRPEDTSVRVARLTTLFLNVFRPIIWFMNTIGNAVVRLLGFEPAGGHTQVHSAEELAMLVQSSRQAGLLEESEEVLLRRAFDFADLSLEAIMQPRVAVEAISVDAPMSAITRQVSQHHYSRYPVYEESLDRVIGILHTKDLLDVLVARPGLLTTGDTDFTLRAVLREPLYLPESVTVDKALAEMQRTQTQFVVVIDEYGGMAGVVTMEDVIERLVGDVKDEFDIEPIAFLESGDAAEIDGMVPISDVIDRFGAPEQPPLSATIGGYIAERLERIPALGDQVVFGGYDVRVVAMDGLRVARVLLARRTPLS